MPDSLPPDLVALRDRTSQLGGELATIRDDATLDAAAKRSAYTAASKRAGLFPMTQPKAFGGSEASLATRSSMSQVNTRRHGSD